MSKLSIQSEWFAVKNSLTSLSPVKRHLIMIERNRKQVSESRIGSTRTDTKGDMSSKRVNSRVLHCFSPRYYLAVLMVITCYYLLLWAVLMVHCYHSASSKTFKYSEINLRIDWEKHSLVYFCISYGVDCTLGADRHGPRD